MRFSENSISHKKAIDPFGRYGQPDFHPSRSGGSNDQTPNNILQNSSPDLRDDVRPSAGQATLPDDRLAPTAF